MSGRKRPAGKGPASLRPDSQGDCLPAAEPSTHSEVQTKLDLARQFIDMGDPASARHMLGEVLEEGDPAQQREAQRLVDSLP